jgi:hypothetical protein
LGFEEESCLFLHHRLHLHHHHLFHPSYHQVVLYPSKASTLHHLHHRVVPYRDPA